MSNLSLFCVLNTKGFQVKAIVGTYQLRVSNKENKFCLKKILKLLQIHGVSKEQWSKARFIMYGGMETPMKINKSFDKLAICSDKKVFCLDEFEFDRNDQDSAICSDR